MSHAKHWMVLGLFGLLWVVAACGGGQPSEFTSREVLPSCGSIPARQPLGPVSASERAVIVCLIGAYESGSPAEADYTLLTTEGDPIRSWLRILGKDRIELYQHSSDSFGEKGWRYFPSCSSLLTSPNSLPSPGGCGEGIRL